MVREFNFNVRLSERRRRFLPSSTRPVDDLQKWYRGAKVVTAIEGDGGGVGDSSGREAEEEEIIEEEEEEEEEEKDRAN